MRILLAVLLVLGLVACGKDEGSQQQALSASDSARLADVLAAQPEDIKQRYPYRNPQETLEFFGVRPGMTVVEVLPGSGWYSRILLAYLGEEGTLVGADYATALFANFPWMTSDRLAEKQRWVPEWVAKANSWRQPGDAKVAAFQLGVVPPSFHGTADAVLFIRALHNLARFDEAAFLTDALEDAWDVLKPGGVLGVVQHEAREAMPDDWADGSQGYLKRRFVIEQIVAAGFELEAESEINNNSADQPTVDDRVWRLPPSLRVDDEPGQREAMQAVGESHRMTLRFRKP